MKQMTCADCRAILTPAPVAMTLESRRGIARGSTRYHLRVFAWCYPCWEKRTTDEAARAAASNATFKEEIIRNHGDEFAARVFDD